MIGGNNAKRTCSEGALGYVLGEHNSEEVVAVVRNVRW